MLDCFSYREYPLRLELLVEEVECEPLCASRVLWLGDLVEEASCLVYPVLTDVHVLLKGSQGTTSPEGRDVQDPTLLPDGVKREHFVDGYPENLKSS